MAGTVIVFDPSARVEPHAAAVVDGLLVSWRPERGWLCSVHTALPCEHTEGLAEPALDLEV